MKEITAKANSLVGKNVYTDLGCKCVHTCAEFVSVVLAACGYGDVTSVSCTEMQKKMSASPDWSEPEDWMTEGDVIFFDWDHKAEEKPLDHVGIVLGVDGNTVTYINANGNDHEHVTVQQLSKMSSSIAYWMRPVNAAEAETPTYNNCTVSLRTLRKGDKGTNVKPLQRLLFSSGYSVGTSGDDGIFGSATEAAVRNFQTDHKLTCDGICGLKTWTEILK